MADPGSVYICGLYETCGILGRVSSLNRKRAEATIQHRPGPEGEVLDKYATGTAEELLATFPDDLAESVFEDADDAYRRSAKLQVEFDRPER